jgi:hypothetical protein
MSKTDFPPKVNAKINGEMNKVFGAHFGIHSQSSEIYFKNKTKIQKYDTFNAQGPFSHEMLREHRATITMN